MPSDGVFHAKQRLGPYELVRELGRGGFASVWLARREGPGGFEARVAIKLIRIELRMDPAFQKMLIDEAKLAAAINHPNVVNIFELGEVDDTLYLVMEYVSGRPLSILRHMMQRAGTPIPVGILMRILADTCAGLHAAHELQRDGKSLGVIHRDVSPQNILVSDKGAVKLIDFGVAKANDRLAADTTDGHTKGKLRYMAPEQALARPVDRRADVWAVGAVAFDLIEGHPPYDGHNDLARLFKLMDTSPPPTFAAEVPAPIARVVRKALERDPDARWATAADMRAAIEAALDECGLRVTADDVATFFGAALATATDAETDPDGRSEGAVLRERLQRPSAQASTATVDVPMPGGVPALEEPLETLSAIDTSPRGVPRPRSRRVAAAVAAVLLVGLGVAVVGLRRAPVSVAAAPEQAAQAAPAADPRAVPEPEPASSSPVAADPPSGTTSPVPAEPSGAVASSSSALPRPVVRPKPSRPRTAKPPAPLAPPSSRPRYDDRIQ
ncbi:MAG TPA: protein kinase [Labilithrix sp.]|nr:protein kinase [Labilithrix sp.]